MNTSLNTLGRKFTDTLASAVHYTDSLTASKEHAQKVHVSGTGAALTHAYEQLRNAAEYTEEHLLLQHAIRRFYRRVFLARDVAYARKSGEELIVELTLAGYLANDTIALETIEGINQLAGDYLEAYKKLKKENWTVHVLAVEIELLLNTDLKQAVFAQFSYDHFLSTIDRSKFATEDFEIALFVAVQRALLKADDATIRTALLHRYDRQPTEEVYYRETNVMIDRVLTAKTTEKLTRFVNRRGAPLRVLWRLIDEHDNTVQLLGSRDQFLTAYEGQIDQEYAQINKRINAGIVKSVIFLLITKALIGFAIEVPYDYAVRGSILWLPLMINLLFPPVYMVLLRFTLTLPGPANTRSMVNQIDEILYADSQAVTLSRVSEGRRFGVAFNTVYAIFFIAIFGAVAWLLWSLGFSIPAIIIFFVFLSTASFLGFRLSRQVRELEVLDSDQTGVSVIRDFFYIPFAAVGRWMSEKYAKVNIVAMILDMVIELPLKTVLYLIRQWSAFIASKKDEL